jgi:hypothetical protein
LQGVLSRIRKFALDPVVVSGGSHASGQSFQRIDFSEGAETQIGTGPQRSYDIHDTAGCSCEQIIEEQGLGNGHTQFGCSIGAMDNWVGEVAL